MSDSLTVAIALYAIGLAAWAGLAAVRDVPAGPGFRGGLVVLELALVGQALGALASLALGHHAREPATYLGYLAASVLILPVTVPSARSGSRWDAAVLAVVCVALAVVSVRLRATWGGARV